MAGDITFGIRLTADGSAFVGQVRVAREEIEKLSQSSREASGGAKELGVSTIAAGSALGSFAADALKQVVSGLVEFTKQTIASASELDDLSEITGSSVEKLSALTNQFKVSGSNTSVLTTALERLSYGLSKTDEGGTRAAKALALIGVQSRDPATALQEVADRLNQYADGANKAALVQEIFGRGGQALLPLLKDLANDLKVGATVTAEQAKAAEDLEKSWRKLTVQGNALKTMILSDIVPGLNTFITGLTTSRQASLDWTSSIQIAFASFADRNKTIDGLTQKVTGLRGEIEKYKTFGSDSWWKDNSWLAKQQEELKLSETQLKVLIQLRDQYLRSQNPTFGSQMNADRIVESINKLRNAPEVAKKAAAGVDQFAATMKTLEKNLVDSQIALDDVGKATSERTTPAMKRLAELQADPVWAKFTATQRAQIEAILQRTDANQRATAVEEERLRVEKEAAKNVLEIEAAIRKVGGERLKEIESIQRQIDQQRAHNVELVSGKSATDDLTIAELERQQAEISGLPGEEQAVAALQRRIDKLKELKQVTQEGEAIKATQEVAKQAADQAREQERAWKQTIDSISSSFAGFLVDVVNNGSSAFKRLAQNLKAFFLQALAEIAAKQVVVNITGALGLTGSGLAGAASSAGGLLNAVGSGSSLFNAAGGALGSLFGGSAASIAASVNPIAVGAVASGMELGGMAAGTAAMTSAASGMATLASSLAAIAPWAAAAAIAVPLIIKALDKGPAMRTADFIDVTGSRSFSGDKYRTSSLGTFGFDNGKWWSDSMDSAINALLDSIKGIDNAIAEKVGPAVASSIKDALAGQQGYNFGMEGTDVAQSGVAGQILKDRYTVVLNTIEDGLGQLVQGFEGTGEQLANFVIGVVNARETLANLNITGLDLTSVQAMQRAGETIADTVSRIAGQAAWFAQNFTSDADKLAAAQQQINSAFGDLGLAVPATREEFKRLVDGLDLSTESGRRAWQGLMDIAPAWITLAENIGLSQRTIDGVTATLDQHIALLSAEGRSYEALQLQREKELAGMSAQEQGIARLVYEAQDKAKTDELQIRLLELQGKGEEALTLKRERELAALSETDKAIQRQIYAQEDLKTQMNAVAEAARNAAEASSRAAAAQRSIADALLKFNGASDATLSLNALTGAVDDFNAAYLNGQRPGGPKTALTSEEIIAQASNTKWLASLSDQLRGLVLGVINAATSYKSATTTGGGVGGGGGSSIDTGGGTQLDAAAQEIERVRASIQGQIDALILAEKSLAEQRQIELDRLTALDPSLAELQKQLYGLQDQATNAAKAAQLTQQQKEIELQIMELEGRGAEVLAERRKAELAALDESLRPLQERVYALQDEAAAATKAAEIAKQKSSLELQILQLEGRGAEALALQRQAELAAMDESLRPLQERIYALQDEAAAAAAAAQAEATRNNLLIELYTLQGNTAQALALQRDLELARLDAIDPTLAALQREIYAMQDQKRAADEAARAAEELAAAQKKAADEAAQAERERAQTLTQARNDLKSAYDREASALKSTIDRFQQFAQTLRQFRDSLLTSANYVSPEQAYQSAKRAYEETASRALSGDPKAIAELQRVAQAYLEASRGYFGSSSGYSQALMEVQGVLDAVIADNEMQADLAQEQLDALNKQVEGLLDLNDSVLSVADAIAALKALQGADSEKAQRTADDSLDRLWQIDDGVKELGAKSAAGFDKVAGAIDDATRRMLAAMT